MPEGFKGDNGATSQRTGALSDATNSVADSTAEKLNLRSMDLLPTIA